MAWAVRRSLPGVSSQVFSAIFMKVCSGEKTLSFLWSALRVHSSFVPAKLASPSAANSVSARGETSDMELERLEKKMKRREKLATSASCQLARREIALNHVT